MFESVGKLLSRMTLKQREREREREMASTKQCNAMVLLKVVIGGAEHQKEKKMPHSQLESQHASISGKHTALPKNQHTIEITNHHNHKHTQRATILALVVNCMLVLL